MFDQSSYLFPTKLVFEQGASQQVANLVRKFGSRSLLLTSNSEIVQEKLISAVQSALEEKAIKSILYEEVVQPVREETIDTIAYFAKKSQVNMIIALGGRELFLAARTAALLAANHVFAHDLLTSSLPLKMPPLPLISIPTIPSLGEEVSPILNINQSQNGKSFYLCNEQSFPSLAIVDPLLSEAIDPYLIVRSAAASLCLAVEAIISRPANEVVNAFALRSIELLAHNLLLFSRQPTNQGARMALYMVSLLCGMAYSNNRLGLGYSLAAVIDNVTQLDFSTALTILLPHIMEFHLTTSAPSYVQISRALEENIRELTVIEAAIKAVEKIRKTFIELQIPQRISHFAIEKDLLPDIARQAANISFSKNSPQPLKLNDIENILIAAH